MQKMLEKLKAILEKGAVDSDLLPELVAECAELNSRVDQLEELLIMIVRTGWPWDEEGEPNAIFYASKDGFANAMVEARDLLGLGHRSTLTRTEPKT